MRRTGTLIGGMPPSIRGADGEVFAVAAGDGERGVGFADEIRREFAADGMKVGRRDEPARDSCEERRQEQQDQRDADQSSTHGRVGSGA